MSPLEQYRDLIQSRGMVHMQDLLELTPLPVDRVEKLVDQLIADGVCRPYEFAPLKCQALAYSFQQGGGRPSAEWVPGSKVFWYIASCTTPKPAEPTCRLCEYEDSGTCFWHR